MVKGKLHISESLGELILQVVVEEKAAYKASYNNWCTNWLHIQIEELIQ